MALESREPTSFDLLPTASVGSRVVRLWVRQEFLRADVSVTEGQTVQAFIGAINVTTSDVLDAGYGSYVLTEPGPMRDGYLSFHFTAPSSTLSVDDLTPWSEKTIWVNDILWPDVLRYLYAVEGTQDDMNQSQVNAFPLSQARVLTLDRYELVKGGYLPTEVIVRRYLTSSLITGLRAERPMPQPVQYAWNRLRNSLDCLHEDIYVPEILTDAQRVPGFGTENADEVFANGQQFFPRTNFTTWQSHIYRIEQSDRPVNGLYETTTFEALPPAMPQGLILGN